MGATEDIALEAQSPWVVSGDYNEILLQCEKQGAYERTFWHMWDFREARVEYCDLEDLVAECGEVRDIRDRYKRASGHAINLQKTHQMRTEQNVLRHWEFRWLKI
ncbi:uncharacterized protein A4U43_C07F28160 [Asparagus officinalis]|uniref:Uncharacterized protein n=1 Tax=Asparagus officinalis TaxID=4686 RepID=A0A5P1EIL6_ASPOF|nr:uncharacterized protein A4U43_C07F28160 [Asparagus officinalis]